MRRTSARRPAARRSRSRSPTSWHGRGIATILLAHLAELARRATASTRSPPIVLPEQPPDDRRCSATPASPSRSRSQPGELEFELPAPLDAGGARALRGARPRRRRRGRRARAAPGVGRGHRRVAPRGHRSARAVAAQPARGRLHGPPAPSSTRAATRSAACRRYRVDRRRARAGRAGGRSPSRPRAVVDVARECGAAGVRALVVLSAGFAEVGAEGATRQAELLDVCRAGGHAAGRPELPRRAQHGPDVALNATFAPAAPPPGRVALRVAERRVRDRGDRRGRAPRARPLLVRLDRQQGRPLRQRLPAVLGGGRRHRRDRCSTSSRSATRAGSGGSPAASRARKPIVAVKSGRSAAGARAAASHTGALLAASDATVDALFRQAGVIRTDTLGELFDVAALLAAQPLPAGRPRRRS